MKLERKLNKIYKKIARRFDRSYDDVLEAFYTNSTHRTDKAFLGSAYDCSLAIIDPETKVPRDILMYFPDYSEIERTRYFLQAYLTTNADVLETPVIEELISLIERYK